MQKIKVTVKPDGKTIVEVNGVSGSGCKDLTRQLENALGKVTSDEPTAEMYEDSITQRIRQ